MKNKKICGMIKIVLVRAFLCQYLYVKNVKLSIIRRECTMNEIIRAIEAEQIRTDLPSFRVGDNIKVYVKVKEGTRERVQMFEGTVIKKQNGGLRETFTVRRVALGTGVERTFPMNAPIIEKIEISRKGKVRRAKLYYLRDRVGKSAKVKELLTR